MRARKTTTEIRQEQILEAALELIGAEGVYALNMNRIAEKVGIVPSALYRHFKSKDEILDAILALIKKRLLANVSQVGKETPDALNRLKAVLMRHTNMLNENRAIPHIVFSDGFYTGRPERKAKVAEIITSYLEKIQEIIEEGKQQGAIRKDIDPATTAILFIGMTLPAAVLWNVTEGRFDMAAHAENAWPAFVESIGVKL